MANAENILIATRSDVTRILDLIEQAQAIAAARTQEITKLGGGAAALAGVDWTGKDVTQQQMFDALSSLDVAMPDLLEFHGSNLYKVKL